MVQLFVVSSSFIQFHPLHQGFWAVFQILLKMGMAFYSHIHVYMYIHVIYPFLSRSLLYLHYTSINCPNVEKTQ